MTRLLLIAFFFLLFHKNINAQVTGSREAFLMGGRFDITLVATDSLTAEHFIDTIIAEITRIEYLISDWKAETQVSEINRNAGIRPVKVDREVLELTERAIRISKLTKGAFDISFAAMEKIWRFDGSEMEMPSRTAIKKARANVGYKNIIINRDSSTIYLRKKGMKIGFGALGEGFAVDKCRDMMIERRIKSGLINATGDIQAWGTRADGKLWKIGINNPFESGSLIGALKLNGGVATSGNYEKYVMINGKRYAHIINPATGYPATGLTSVTITGPDTEMANTLSTSIMVLGKKKGQRLLKRNPSYSGLLITDKGEQILTKGFNLEDL